MSKITEYRQAKAKDIIKEAKIYIYGDDEKYLERTIDEVLRPNDSFKAFVADDGCRYGLDSTFIKINKRKKFISQIEKCKEFLIKNGWEYTKLKGSFYDEYHSFNKEGFISIEFGDNDMVFLDDRGDFLIRDVDYYTLIGVLLENRQLPFNYKSI